MQELADKERAFNTKAMADFAKAQQERMGVFERKVAADNDASAKAMQAQMAELAKGHRTEWVRDKRPRRAIRGLRALIGISDGAALIGWGG